MTTKLKLYNKALLYCKERKLASLTEEGKPRRLLDEVYDDSIEYCLEEGLWKFATQTVRIDYDESIAPLYGYRRAFVKPSDWTDPKTSRSRKPHGQRSREWSTMGRSRTPSCSRPSSGIKDTS